MREKGQNIMKEKHILNFQLKKCISFHLSIFWWLGLQVSVSTRKKKKSTVIKEKPANDISYPLDPAMWMCPVERYRILHTDPLLPCCFQERRHAIVAIFWIRTHSSYPSPTKVFYQLGQSFSLELITRNCSEETWVLPLIRQTCTCGKVAHLKDNNSVIRQ